MKPRHYVLLLVVLSIGLECGYKIGHHAGENAIWKAAHHWATVEGSRIGEIQAREVRRVLAEREASMYQKGFERCQEQF